MNDGSGGGDQLMSVADDTEMVQNFVSWYQHILKNSKFMRVCAIGLIDLQCL